MRLRFTARFVASMSLLLACAGSPVPAQNSPSRFIGVDCMQASSTSVASGPLRRDIGTVASVTDDGVSAGRIFAMATQVATKSYPEVAHRDWQVRAFHSDYDYFRTRFSIWRFLLLFPMRYYVEVNPLLFDRNAPADGVCSILAHELVHVRDLTHGNRLRRFGLIRLFSPSYTIGFERRTDLEAIHRGYANGLKSYRTWIYANIPADKVARKRRTYFSPEEIAAIELELAANPGLLETWRKTVPRSVAEIQAAATPVHQ